MQLNIKKIKDEMRRQGMTQVQLAKRLRLTKQRVNYILKNGARSFGVVQKIAKVFNLDPKDLII